MNKYQVQETDTRLVARLKLIYLVPLIFIIAIPVSLIITLFGLLIETFEDVKNTWNHKQNIYLLNRKKGIDKTV